VTLPRRQELIADIAGGRQRNRFTLRTIAQRVAVAARADRDEESAVADRRKRSPAGLVADKVKHHVVRHSSGFDLVCLEEHLTGSRSIQERLVGRDLGVVPSPPTEALHREILGL
jgi:hypothetical protein